MEEANVPVGERAGSGKPPLSYRVGDVTKVGIKIAFIYGQSDAVIVYRGTDNVVQWETTSDSLSRRENRVNQAYDRLADRVQGSLPRSQRARFRNQLAEAFFLGLTEADEAEALKAFSTSENTISEAALYRARLIYVVAGTVAATVAGTLVGYALARLPAGPAQTLALGALAGFAGAWTSVLIRSGSLAVGPYQASPQYAFQGATRIILGGLFGLVAAIAAKANLLLGFAFDNQWVMTIVTLFAGFSERFVPELLKSLEDHHPTLSTDAPKSPPAEQPEGGS